MPEKALKKLNNCILPQWKVCFFAGLIIGVLAHLYKIANWLPNWDSLVFRYDPQNMVSLGRWFLPVACSFSSFYDLPFLNGIIAIVFHALSAVCICKVLDVEKNMTAFMIGAVVVSFPTVTSVMMYNYVADGYSIALFLSSLAAVLMMNEKPRYVISSVLIALSAGIYQAYITVTIMLILIKLIDGIVYHNAAFAEVLKKGVFMLLSGILGMAIYGVMLKVSLSILSAELIDYQGVNAAVSFSNINLPASLYTIKETFLSCLFDLSEGISIYFIINVLIFLLTLFYYVKYIVRNKVYKSPAKIIAVVILGVTLVVGAAALAIINADVDYHNLMRMGYVFFYVFFLMLYERGTDKNEKHTSIKCWIVLVTALVLIMNQIVIANVSYHKAQIAYEKSYGVLVRIADRIEQTPKADECTRILVIGSLENSHHYSSVLPPEITGITDGLIIRFDDEIVGQSVLCSALNDYCGTDYDFVSGEEKDTLLQREEVEELENWPCEGCITVIDEILVIKLGKEGVD